MLMQLVQRSINDCIKVIDMCPHDILMMAQAINPEAWKPILATNSIRFDDVLPLQASIEAALRVNEHLLWKKRNG